MAIGITNGAVNISTASGFYRVEAHNLSWFSATTLSLSSTRTISLTYANTGNATGVMLALVAPSQVSAANMKSVTVTLKESGVTRASATLTGTQIANGIADARSDLWLVPFTFSAPYAITTTPAVWTIDITNATGTTDWAVRTSNGTAVTYAAWCDNLISYSANDTIIAKDILTIDQAATLRGVTSTGDTTNAPALIVCKGSDGTPTNVSNVRWASSPASAYTLTIDGIVGLGAHSGFRAGTSASPISIANAGLIDFIAPTVGTVNGFQGAQRALATFDRKSSLFIYGEVPATEKTELAENAVLGGTVTFSNGSATITRSNHGYSVDMPIFFQTTGGLPTNFSANTRYYVVAVPASNQLQVSSTVGGVAIVAGSAGSGTQTIAPIIVTTATTGWAINDKIAIGKRNVKGQGDVTNHTIQAISGTEIMTTVPITSATAFEGGTVSRLNGYGFKIKTNTVSTSTISYLKCPSNFQISGCELENFSVQLALSNGLSGDDSANTEAVKVSHCSSYYTLSSTTTSLTVCPNEKGLLVEYLNGFRNVPFAIQAVTYTASMTTLFSRYNTLLSVAAGTYTAAGQTNIVVQNNSYENGGSNLSLTGTNITHKDNTYWGSNAGLLFNSIINTIDSGGNKYQNCATGMNITGTVINYISTDDIFTDTIGSTTNTTDFTFSTNIFIQMELASPTGNLNISTTNLATLITGSYIRFSSFNDTFADDRSYMPEGYYQRTGYALSDTLVNTIGTTFAAASAGQYAMRFQPISGTTDLTFSQRIPTGDISGKAMTVLVRSKINNANFYAGANYQLPKLTVNYDNGTEASFTSASSTDGQAMYVTFIPVTSYGEITVTFSAGTDASSTDAYVYWGGFAALYPAGVTVSLGSMSLWANAVPITPMIATLASAYDMWAADPAAFTNNTVGKYIIRILRLCGLIPAGL